MQLIRSLARSMVLLFSVLLLVSGCTKKTTDSTRTGPVQGSAQGSAQSASLDRLATPEIKNTQIPPQGGPGENKAPRFFHQEIPQSSGARPLQPPLVLRPPLVLQPPSVLQPHSKSTSNLTLNRCYSMTFRHPDDRSNYHKNLIRIPRPNLEAQSICVRVAGKPVPFQMINKNKINKSETKLIIGSLARDQRNMTVSFCVQGGHCADPCKIPKDEFLEALGAGGAAEGVGGEGMTTAGWDPNGNAPAVDLAKEIDPAVMRELLGASELEIFDGWIASPPREGCSTQGG